MLRATIAIALAAGVSVAAAAPRAPSPAPPSKASKAKAKAAKAKAAKLAKAKAAKASRRRGGVAKATGNNMPRGFVWPPSQVMRDAEAACERELDEAHVAWSSAPSEGHIAAAVTIDDRTLGGIAYVPVYGKGPHKMDCQLARALVAVGPELAAAGVREVHFGSIYRWSNVRVGGKTKNALSRHALGLAMDVVSFVDAAGREATVARDYLAGDGLLHDVERAINASGSFRLVLTPQNDPLSHHDHFHLEANPSYAQLPPRS